MTRILVAGATGYLGRHVARELKARGHFVRALVRNPGNHDDLLTDVDDVVGGEITRPETLAGLCDGMEVVFSSAGITRQKDGLTWQDVDYQGNRNLLDDAMRAGVRRFVYVSAVGGPELTHLDMVKAHEDFVAELGTSGMDHTVVRPTGFFSDMEDLLHMGRKGRVFLIGTGRSRINPIHGADLAVVCADMVDEGPAEVEVGGPEIFTWRDAAALALRSAGKPEKISTIPLSIMALVIFCVRLFSRHNAELLAFFTSVSARDVLAPPTGRRTLGEHFRQLESNRQ